MAQFLIANPGVKAVFARLGRPTVGAGAIKDAGVKVLFGGFRLAVEIVTVVESGAMFATMTSAALPSGLLPDRPDRALEEVRAGP